MSAALVAGDRTAFCRPQGRLRDATPAGLAAAAATGLEWDVVVAASVLGGGDDLVATLAQPAQLAVQLGGADGAGLVALAVGAGLVRHGRVLVVGADSATHSPYLVPRPGPGSGAPSAADPLGGVVAAAGARAAAHRGDREAEDAWAARSRAAVEARDEPRPYGDLADLMPLFDPDGTATAASTALPADGAAAALLVDAALAPPGALHLLDAAAHIGGLALEGVVAAEVHEGTACEAIAVSRSLGLERETVNALGGAIGLGHPVAASGVAMALRLRRRLAAMGGGRGLLVAPGIAISAELT